MECKGIWQKNKIPVSPETSCKKQFWPKLVQRGDSAKALSLLMCGCSSECNLRVLSTAQAWKTQRERERGWEKSAALGGRVKRAASIQRSLGL